MIILRIYSIVVLIFTLLTALINNRKKVDGVSLSIAELIFQY